MQNERMKNKLSASAVEKNAVRVTQKAQKICEICGTTSDKGK